MIAVAMIATNHHFTYKTLYVETTDLGRYLSQFVPSLPIQKVYLQCTLQIF